MLRDRLEVDERGRRWAAHVILWLGMGVCAIFLATITLTILL